MLNSFLCLVFWWVLVFVNSPIGPVYTHFTADVITVPLILETHESQAKYLNVLRVMLVL